MTTKEKYKLVCDTFNLTNFYELGFEGQNVKICNVESNIEELDDHGYDAHNVVKTYAPKATIVSYRDEMGKSVMSDFDGFIDWCIENKVDIITCSLDLLKYNKIEALKKAYDNNIIMCCCMDNDDTERTNNSYYISCSEHTIGVSSITLSAKGKIDWGDHNFGEAVDVLTLGKQLPVKNEKDIWYNKTGQSFGTPLVAAMIAVWKSSGTHITSKNVLPLIEKYAKHFTYKDRTYDIITLPSLKDSDYTYEEPIKESQEDWKKEFAIAVEEMKKMNMTDGLRLKDNITREEVIVMLYRIYKQIKGELKNENN